MPINRLAALALLALAIWSVVALVEAPLVARVQADRAQIAEAEALLGSGDAAAAAGQLRAQQARGLRFVRAATWRLDGSSAELLSAQLQRMIEASAAQAGAVVASSRTAPSQLQEGLTRVKLELDVQATLPALQRLLLAIEAARPPVFVDRLSIERPESGGATGSDGQGVLAVGLHLSIYAAPAAAVSPS